MAGPCRPGSSVSGEERAQPGRRVQGVAKGRWDAARVPTAHRHARPGWPRASAGYAVTKGNRTRATTRRPEIRQEFSPF